MPGLAKPNHEDVDIDDDELNSLNLDEALGDLALEESKENNGISTQELSELRGTQLVRARDTEINKIVTLEDFDF